MANTTRPIVPTEHADEREHRRLLAVRASASLPKDGTEGMVAPLKLMSYATADLPTASLYPGAVVYNSDTDLLMVSDGAGWTTFVPAATEAAWTPGMTFGGSATGVTFTTAVGYYIKTDKLVTAWCRVALTNNGTGVGAALVTGLPFVASTITGIRWAVTVGGPANYVGNWLSGYVGSGGNEINLVMDGTAATDTMILNSFGAAFTVVYRTG